MKFRVIVVTIGLLMMLGAVFGQNATLKGRVFNAKNNEAVPFASVYLDSTTVGTTTDIDGNYVLNNLNPGTYNISCSFIGFTTKTIYEVRVTATKPTTIDFAMEESVTTLGEVEIVSSPFNTSAESPLSVQTISSTEIYRNPGSNRDISRVIQVLPGVATTVSFRNDIIVRGGAPNENRFYLDGIEVPNINHFATQGSSGGPVGMINVNFIRDVDFYAGAFPANRGNALSSVMNFNQVEGNNEKIAGNFMVGSSDIGLTLEGPISKNTTFIASARRSYLQLLFKALALPFLPTYNDFQFKTVTKINNKNTLTFLGLGAIDDFELNQTVNENETDPEVIERNNYILGNLPVNTQWNYAVGGKWVHFANSGFYTMVASRNHLYNKSVKYKDNIEAPENLLLDYVSEEIENKFRFESNQQKQAWKYSYGVAYEYVTYTNQTYNQAVVGDQVTIIDFSSELSFQKFGGFVQASRSILKNRLTLSLGLRTDFNSYSSDMSNPLEQLSPRFSASYLLSEKWTVNFNTGRYYQLPPYTVLGYRDSENTLVNKENNISYIQSDHLVAGLAFLPNSFAKITVEGFYKKYDNYPFLLSDSLSLANLGGDFGIIGNEPANSTSFGESYGLELMIQQTLSKSLYGILSFTLVRSRFNDKNGELVASSWDNQYILNLTAGKKLPKNWEVGFKFRLFGGSPFTPFNIELSSQKEVWDVTQRGIPDYNRLNTERNSLTYGLDLRIDKNWYFDKWALNLYFDIQNATNAQTTTQPFLDVVRDDQGNPVEDPNNPNAYQTKLIENTTGTLLPSIGLMVEF